MQLVISLYGTVSIGVISVGVSVGGGVKEGVGVRVRVGSGVGGGGVGVWVGVKVWVSEGGMNCVSVRVGDGSDAGAVVFAGGGWRRVEVACALGLGTSSTVGVEWMKIRTAAVQ